MFRLLLKGNCSPALGLQKAPSFVSVSAVVSPNEASCGLGERARPRTRATSRAAPGACPGEDPLRPQEAAAHTAAGLAVRPSPSTHETSFYTRGILRPLCFAHGKRDSRLSRFENTTGSLCEYKGLLGASARRANQFCVWSGRQWAPAGWVAAEPHTAKQTTIGKCCLCAANARAINQSKPLRACEGRLPALRGAAAQMADCPHPLSRRSQIMPQHALLLTLSGDSKARRGAAPGSPRDQTLRLSAVLESN